MYWTKQELKELVDLYSKYIDIRFEDISYSQKSGTLTLFGRPLSTEEYRIVLKHIQENMKKEGESLDERSNTDK